MQFSMLLESWMSLVIIGITLIISIWALIDEDFRDKMAMVPYDMIMYREYWRLLTSGLVHGSVVHLTLNMTTFYFFAPVLERHLGHWQLAGLYMLGLLLSNAATAIRYYQDSSYEGSVGASGAISAVVLSAVVCNPFMSLGLPVLSAMYPVLTLPAYIAVLLFMAFSLIASLVPQTAQGGVNHDAHFWGAVSGIALTFVFNPQVTGVLHHFWASL
ncbi:MAG: rhomboid family intramembrane serine protease [Bacteroidia bacterium]|nr:rhomboid family intramembrane serine protease [Bacteroidia bacterium]